MSTALRLQCVDDGAETDYIARGRHDILATAIRLWPQVQRLKADAGPNFPIQIVFEALRDSLEFSIFMEGHGTHSLAIISDAKEIQLVPNRHLLNELLRRVQCPDSSPQP